MKTAIIKGLLFLIIALSLAHCAVKVPLPNNYYENEKRVGVLYKMDTIDVYRQGQQGLLDMALTMGVKYQEPLAIVDEKLLVEERVKNLYAGIFTEQKKKLKEVEFDQDIQILQKFEPPSKTKKKYHKHDLRVFRNKGIDELLVVTVRYGLVVSYYGMIETGRIGNCEIVSEIVNLKDNSLIYRNIAKGNVPIQGKWKTPPEYDKMTNSIDSAIILARDIEHKNLGI